MLRWVGESVGLSRWVVCLLFVDLHSLTRKKEIKRRFKQLLPFHPLHTLVISVNTLFWEITTAAILLIHSLPRKSLDSSDPCSRTWQNRGSNIPALILEAEGRYKIKIKINNISALQPLVQGMRGNNSPHQQLRVLPGEISTILPPWTTWT